MHSTNPEWEKQHRGQLGIQGQQADWVHSRLFKHLFGQHIQEGKDCSGHEGRAQAHKVELQFGGSGNEHANNDWHQKSCLLV